MLMELVGINKEWTALALTLDIPHHQIEEIETNYPNNVSKCREKMVDRWFQRGRQLSWSSLCTALREPLVSRPDIAAVIQHKYSIKS